jgi:hypothetical protein
MSATRDVTIAAYTAAAIALAAVEVAARREGSRIPSLGALWGFVMRYRAAGLPVGRIAVYGFLWWVGWHFFAR